MTHTAGIVLDNYKLPVFEAGLKEAGYTYTQHSSVDRGTTILFVDYAHLTALQTLITELNRKAIRVKDRENNLTKEKLT